MIITLFYYFDINYINLNRFKELIDTYGFVKLQI